MGFEPMNNGFANRRLSPLGHAAGWGLSPETGIIWLVVDLASRFWLSVWIFEVLSFTKGAMLTLVGFSIRLWGGDAGIWLKGPM